MNPIFIVLPILLLLMFGLGLSFKPADFAVLLRQPKAVLVGTVAQVVLLPLLAGGLAGLFEPEPYLLVGLMLIACSPGGHVVEYFHFGCQRRCAAVGNAYGVEQHHYGVYHSAGAAVCV